MKGDKLNQGTKIVKWRNSPDGRSTLAGHLPKREPEDFVYTYRRTFSGPKVLGGNYPALVPKRKKEPVKCKYFKYYLNPLPHHSELARDQHPLVIPVVSFLSSIVSLRLVC